LARGEEEMGNRKRVGIIVLGLALIGLSALASAESRLTPSIGPAQAAALLEQAKPHIEAVMGFRLEPVPRIRLAAAADLPTWQRREIETQLRWQFPDLAAKGGADLPTTVAASVEAFRSACIAGLKEGREEILLLPANSAAMAQWAPGLQGVNSSAFWQLALVHEAVRCALEYRYGFLGRPSDSANAESFLVQEAQLYGKTQWVTGEVAKRLGTQAYFPLMSQIWLHVPDTLGNPALRAATQEALRQRHWAYTHGLSFFEALQKTGIHDVDVAVFGRSPCPLAWIEQPERFVRARANHQTALDIILAALEHTLPPDEWVGKQEPCTPAMIKQVASTFGEGARAESLLIAGDEARQLIWTSKKPGRTIALDIVRFDSPLAGKGYYDFACELQRRADERAGKSSDSIRLVDVRSRQAAISGVDEGAWTDKKLLVAGTEVSGSVLLMHAGTLVIELQWQGLRGDEAWAQRLVQTIQQMHGGL
jgi:hypothetical protein